MANEKKYQLIKVNVTLTTKKQLEQVAAVQRTSVSSIVRDLINDYLKKNDKARELMIKLASINESPEIQSKHTLRSLVKRMIKRRQRKKLLKDILNDIASLT